MIFNALKGTVDHLIEEYKCLECKCGITSDNVNIIGAAGSTINMEIICPECKKSEFIEAQVVTLDLSKIIPNKEKIELLKDKLKDIQDYKSKITDVQSLLEKKKDTNNQKIKDENIILVNKILKSRNFSLMDLFGEEKK